MSPSSLPSNPPALPPRPLLFAVALVAASILLFEIALARVFGTVLRYHLSFLAISMALCGLGVGGFTVHWVRPRARIVLPTLGITFAVSIVAALLVLLRVVMARVPEEYWISALVVLVPFSLGGAWLAEAFARFPRHAGRVYAWDLGGAALAALVAVPVLNFLSAPAAVVAAAVLGGAGAVLSLLDYEGEAERFKSLQRARWIVPSALCLLLLLMGAPGGKGVQRLLDVPPLPPKPDEMGRTLNQRGITQDLFTELGTPNNKSRVVETRHNAFARTDVVDDPMSPGGFLLYTNGNVPTNMMRWDGRVSSLNTVAQDFRLSDWCFAAAALGRPKTSVFSIGPGGGLDALFALRHKAARFDGAEINPSILDIMSARAGMNGNIYNRANVRVEVADGRAFARRALARGQKYDLMFSALTKTATAGQGMALLESFIHTREAFGDYWALLKPRGQATLVLDNSPLLARFTATWLDVLQARGIGSREAMRHIAIVRDPMPGPYVFALVVQKSPFSRAESDALARAANARGLEAVWIPTQAALPIYGPYPRLGDGTMDLPAFIRFWSDESRRASTEQPDGRSTELDISPRSDDRPFVLDLSPHAPPGMGRLALFAGVLAVGLAALGLLLPGAMRRQVLAPGDAQVLAPGAAPADAGAGKDLAKPDEPGGEQVLDTDTAEEGVKSEAPRGEQVLAPGSGQVLARRGGARDVAWIAYFLALGVGFMVVEIPLSQILILPLGYPTLALSVILFAILLGGGAGAWASQRFEGRRLATYAAACALLVALGALAAPWAVRQSSQWLGLWSINARVAAVVMALLPLGFVLGTPFPAGMRLFAQRRAESVPLVWGLNGVASVVGSLCAALGAKAFGFTQTMAYGAAIYVVAALAVWALGRGEEPPATEPEASATASST